MSFHLLNYLGYEMPGVFHTTYSGDMSGVFHTTYSGRTLGGGVKCQVCFTQYTQTLGGVCEMAGVFHTAYSGHTLVGNVKYKVCLTQHTQVLKKYWGIAISSK